MDHLPFLEQITESTDISQPPLQVITTTGSSSTSIINPYSNAEMVFPLTTLGVSSHNILTSSSSTSTTTPYLINPNNIDSDAYNISTYLQDPILFDDINQASEMDDGVLIHLLLAYAEAIEMDQESLAEVMVKRISQKVSPVGDSTVERLMYYMFQNIDKNQSDYFNQEAIKNFYPAFKAFYTIFPNGKFAHFAANHVIFTSLMTNEIMILRIFDFDIGEGIQWAPLIEALGHQDREVVVTTIKLNEDTMWRFEDTKKRLCDYATTYGLMLKVEEMELSDLVGDDIQEKLVAKGNGKPELFAFNAMFGLPHMGRRQRSRKDVFEFVKAAQDLLRHAACRNQRGVIILGDGDAWEKFRNVNYTYSSFLDGKMMCYQALLESMYVNFPPNLREARTCMECLFVAPFVSCGMWAKAWGEAKLGSNNIEDLRFCLQGWNFSQECLMEAKEMVKEGESMYGVRIDGDTNNEIVMDWRGIPLIRVSCWTS